MYKHLLALLHVLPGCLYNTSTEADKESVLSGSSPRIVRLALVFGHVDWGVGGSRDEMWEQRKRVYLFQRLYNIAVGVLQLLRSLAVGLTS